MNVGVQEEYANCFTCFILCVSHFQIQKVMCALGDFMNIKVHACIGGTSIRDDLRKLEEGVHVIVGTPGRVNDMINRGVLRK